MFSALGFLGLGFGVFRVQVVGFASGFRLRVLRFLSRWQIAHVV